MKIKIKKIIKEEVNAKTLMLNVGPRYWEDSIVDGEEDTKEGSNIPCRVGDRWKPLIDIDSGLITNWEKGKEAHIHYKVCDDGDYFILDGKDKVILSIENNYVPDILSINDQGYGDYIILSIDIEGKIKDWKFNHFEFIAEVE